MALLESMTNMCDSYFIVLHNSAVINYNCTFLFSCLEATLILKLSKFLNDIQCTSQTSHL